MSLFLTVFFLLYASMHGYVFLKAKHACHFGVKPSVLLTIIMLAMIFAPIIVRFCERTGHEYSARIAAYAGYTWMAALFLFFSISICIDIFMLCLHATGFIFKINFSSIIHAYRLFFIISLVCSLSIVVYGYYEAGQIKTERLVIKTPKISKEKGTLKIVQISDVHLGLIIKEARLNKILIEIKKANPDILVSTGDLVDGQLKRVNGIIESLKGINPPYGKFAVMGNHEFYAGIDTSLDFLKSTGFIVLRGRGLTVEGIINIAGVDDIASMPYNYAEIPENVLLQGFPKDIFTLLLKHRPVVDRTAVNLFDLQLSGHTHKGQIFPFNFIVRLFFPMDNGYSRLSGTSYLYINRGSGTWGPPIRFLSPPEVTIIELVHQPKQ